jgi:calcineurin-like phosphoesterase family protein
MSAVFLVSDTHFGHQNVCTLFKRQDGSPLRPFASAEEMDETMIQRWNDRVRPNDKVYHLGDVAMQRKHLSTLSRLNGDKILIKGNHDIFKLDEYKTHFRDIRAYHVMNGMILSHIPVHKSSISRFGCNIHGHTHASRVLDDMGNIDPNYFCVSVEQIDYTPILFEHVVKHIVEQGGQVGFRARNGNVD